MILYTKSLNKVLHHLLATTKVGYLLLDQSLEFMTLIKSLTEEILLCVCVYKASKSIYYLGKVIHLLYSFNVQMLSFYDN